MAIITISRGTFSGGQIIAECVAKKLGYSCISREVLVETSRKYGLTEEKLFKAVCGVPGIVERFRSERKRYLACLRANLISMARDNNLVYHGHAGHFLLKGVPCTLIVRVIASMDFRIQSLTNRQCISQQEAIKYIKRVDEERVRWTAFLYHVDWRDPASYDMIINLDKMTLSSACDVLCDTVKLQEYAVTAKSQKLMDDLVLSSHIEAVIATSGNISSGEDIEIEANGGVVTLRGTVVSLADADRVRTIVSRTPGVEKIISEMRVRLPGLAGTKINEN